MPPLDNPRWERFARALFEGETADAAFVKAGYSKNRGNASRLKANESILARVAELQAAAAKSSEVTVKSLLDELEQARVQATSLRQFSAVVRSIESKARISGLLTEKIEVTNVYQRFESCDTTEAILRQMCIEYQREGYNLSEADLAELDRLLTAWTEVLAAAKARPVNALSPMELQRHERKRLGLAQRPSGNGSTKSV